MNVSAVSFSLLVEFSKPISEWFAIANRVGKATAVSLASHSGFTRKERAADYAFDVSKAVDQGQLM